MLVYLELWVKSSRGKLWFSRELPEKLWSEVKWSEVAQSCPTLFHPMDCNLPGSCVHGIFQARVLESISFSRGSSQPRARTQVSHIVNRCFTVWATRVVKFFLRFFWGWDFVRDQTCPDLLVVVCYSFYGFHVETWNTAGILKNPFPCEAGNRKGGVYGCVQSDVSS